MKGAALDLGTLGIIVLSVFALLRPTDLPPPKEPYPAQFAQATWVVIACDDFKKDRSRCGLVRTEHHPRYEE